MKIRGVLHCASRGLYLICLLGGIGFSGLAAADTYEDLLFATRFNDAETVQTLLLQGTNVNTAEQQRGETLLMIAIREKSGKVVDLLLKQPQLQLEMHAKNGDTALMIASFLGDLELVQKLVNAGAEVNQPGWAALHYAAANGNTDLIDFLLSESAYIDAESPNKTTPLMMAVRFGKYDAANLLIEQGADITLKNDQGATALDFAMGVERNDLIELLWKKMAEKKR